MTQLSAEAKVLNLFGQLSATPNTISDCRYRLWDGFGRPLWSSNSHGHPVTCVAWSPSGEMFVVGAYKLLRLCDRAGVSFSESQPIFKLGFNEKFFVFDCLTVSKTLSQTEDLENMVNTVFN